MIHNAHFVSLRSVGNEMMIRYRLHDHNARKLVDDYWENMPLGQTITQMVREIVALMTDTPESHDLIVIPASVRELNSAGVYETSEQNFRVLTVDADPNDKHKWHAVTVGLDGTNRCECGDEWPNMIGTSPLDALLNGVN